MARHGGVTRDVLSKFRSWPEAKSRGRWAADTTLRRYAKPGILNRYLEMCPADLVEFGGEFLVNDGLMRQFRAALAGGPAPKPPSASVTGDPLDPRGRPSMKKPAAAVTRAARSNLRSVKKTQAKAKGVPQRGTGGRLLPAAPPRPAVLRRPAACSA